MRLKITQWTRIDQDSTQWPTPMEMIEGIASYDEPIKTQVTSYLEAHEQMTMLVAFSNAEAQYLGVRNPDTGTLYTILAFPTEQAFIANEEYLTPFAEIREDFVNKRTAMLATFGVSMTVYSRVDSDITDLSILSLEQIQGLIKNATPV